MSTQTTLNDKSVAPDDSRRTERTNELSLSEPPHYTCECGWSGVKTALVWSNPRARAIKNEVDDPDELSFSERRQWRQRLRQARKQGAKLCCPVCERKSGLERKE